MQKPYSLMYRMKQKEGGSGYHAIFLAQTYSHLFKQVNIGEVADLNEIPNRIWMLHNPFFYKNTSLVSRHEDFSFSRIQFLSCIPGKHLTNGYSYFKSHGDRYFAWMPTIYFKEFQANRQSTCIGYYIRDARVESNLAFASFIDTLPKDIPVVTMGQKEVLEKRLSSNQKWKHVYDHEEFWRTCSHYFYFRASDIEDPLPHTLLEAIQSRHRIISPKNQKRNFEDGIDDLLSCVDSYDIALDENENQSQSQCLGPELWKPYMEMLSKERFRVPQRSSVASSKSLYAWIDKNLRG